MYKANYKIFMIITSILFYLLWTSVGIIRISTANNNAIHFSRISLLMMCMCILLAINNLYMTHLKNGIGLFGGLYFISSNTQVYNIFILVLSAIIILLSAFYYRNILNKNQTVNKKYSKIFNSNGEQYKIIEYCLLILFILMGAILLMSTGDIISIFLSIELQSYGLYLLSTAYRNSESGTKGGLTYFLLGGLSSCFILLATAILYSNSGTTSLDGIYIISSISEIIESNEKILYKSYYLNLSLLILSVGFLFKVASAPFHNWSPDVYDAIPTVVTTFVAIIAKISIFIFLLQLVHYTNNSYFSFNWTSGLLLSSLLSLIIGTIGGLRQFRIKRLFAYSTISHVGFILLALSISSVESIQAFLFYLMQYSLVNLNAFLILLSIGYSLYSYVNNDKQYQDLVDKINSPIQLISQLKGYFYLNPILTLSLAITIFSFVGIPPLIGFFGKQMVLSAGLDNGYIFIVLVGIITSVISAAYYLNIIKQIYFDSNQHVLINKNTYDVKDIILSNSLAISISCITLIILLFMFGSDAWLSNANILALILFDP